MAGERDFAEISTRNLLLEELLAFPEPVHRFALLAELHRHQGGIANRLGNRVLETTVTDAADDVFERYVRQPRKWADV